MATNETTLQNKNVVASTSKSKAWSVVRNIFFYLALLFILVFAGFSIYGRLNGGTLRFGDDEVRIVLTGSMDGEPTSYRIPTIKTGSAVLIEDVPGDETAAATFYEKLAVGDVLTFIDYLPNGSSVLVSHRIIAISESSNPTTYLYTLKGDADSGLQSVSSAEGLVVGQVTSVSYPWGVFLTFLSGQWGLLILVILPSCLICAYEIGKIIVLVRGTKKATSDARIQELEAQVQSLKEEKENKEGDL
jgi:hypothetical protein